MSFPPFCDILIQQVSHWVTYVIRSIGEVFFHRNNFFIETIFPKRAEIFGYFAGGPKLQNPTKFPDYSDTI